MAASRPFDPVDKHDERHQRQNENQPDHHDNFLANDPVIGLAGPPALPEPPGSPDWGTHGRLILHKRGIRKTLATALNWNPHNHWLRIGGGQVAGWPVAFI